MDLLHDYYIRCGFYEGKNKHPRHSKERMQEIQELKKLWEEQIKEIQFNLHRPEPVEIL